MVQRTVISTLSALAAGLAGSFIGGFVAIFLGQVAAGRVGKPIDEEGMLSLIGMPLGFIVFAWLGWKLTRARTMPKD